MQSSLVFRACALATCSLGVAAAARAEPPAGVSQHPDFDDRGGGTWAPNRRGFEVLAWDDGSYESGLGFFSGSGLAAMRFGGAPPTTRSLPVGVIGAYWRLYPGFAVENVNINLFYPLTPAGLPRSFEPLLQVPATTNTTGTNFVSIPGPIIDSPPGNVMLGVGIQNEYSWFVAADTGIANHRQFLGGSNTTNLTYGPATLSSLGFDWNFLIRLVIDGLIPVELQSFSVDK